MVFARDEGSDTRGVRVITRFKRTSFCDMNFLYDDGNAKKCSTAQYCQRYLDFVVESVGLSEEPSSEFFAQVKYLGI